MSLALLTFKNVNCGNWFMSVLLCHTQIFKVPNDHKINFVLTFSDICIFLIAIPTVPLVPFSFQWSAHFPNHHTSVFLSYICTHFYSGGGGLETVSGSSGCSSSTSYRFYSFLCNMFSITWPPLGFYWNLLYGLPFHLQFYLRLCLLVNFIWDLSLFFKEPTLWVTLFPQLIPKCLCYWCVGRLLSFLLTF